MNKTTISMLLLAIAAAAGSLYALGAFGETSTSASIKITESKEQTPSTSTTTKPRPTSSGAITKETVSEHAVKNDCWTIINGNVYNLTSYLPMHPGGQDVIIEACGGDGTSVFASIRKHSQANVQAELATYLVGKLR